MRIGWLAGRAVAVSELRVAVGHGGGETSAQLHVHVRRWQLVSVGQ